MVGCEMKRFSRVLVTGGAGFVRFMSGVGVAEGLGGGLQRGWGLLWKPALCRFESGPRLQVLTLNQ